MSCCMLVCLFVRPCGDSETSSSMAYASGLCYNYLMLCCWCWLGNCRKLCQHMVKPVLSLFKSMSLCTTR